MVILWENDITHFWKLPEAIVQLQKSVTRHAVRKSLCRLSDLQSETQVKKVFSDKLMQEHKKLVHKHEVHADYNIIWFNIFLQVRF